LNSLQFIEDSLRRHDFSGAHPVVLNMLSAIKQIVETIRANPKAKFGIFRNGSKNNLSWVVHEALRPVCANIFVFPGMNASSITNILTAKAKPYDVLLAQDEIKHLCTFFRTATNPPEKRALDLLYGTLSILRNSYSAIRYTKQSEDGPYCKYCYREAIHGTDTCYKHGQHRRTEGKYHYQKYRALLVAVKNKRLFESKANSEKHLPLTYSKLSEKGVPVWSYTNSDNLDEWIALALNALDVCAPCDLQRVSKRILESEKLVKPIQLSSLCHSSINGTLLRHEVYMLVKLRTPSTEIAERLNRVWAGESISAVSLAYGVSRQILHRQAAHWGKNILELHSKGVNKKVIKLVYGLKALPSAN
jgi:hypothetical protein